MGDIKISYHLFQLLLPNKCRSCIAKRPNVLRELNTTPNCRYNKKHWPSKFTLTNNNTKTSTSVQNTLNHITIQGRFYSSNRFFRIEVFACVIVYKNPSRLTLYLKTLYLIIVFFLKIEKKHKKPKIFSS